MSWEREEGKFQSSSHSPQGQYNPFYEEDQLELMERQHNRLSDSRLVRNPKSGGIGIVRYNPATQSDPEDTSLRASEMSETEEFIERDIRASGKCRQFCSISTLIILSQIIIFVLMIRKDGFASQAENPLYGPSASVLVKYGAKQGGYIIYKKQHWRLVTPIFLHAGVIHLITNVYIQYTVGGYLYYMFGPFQWLVIYFGAGIFGNITSCIFLTNVVGVGSSGSLMGILGAWVVFILYTWGKVPPESRCHRNCQLLSVLFAITVTMMFSLISFVDWAAHAGGLVQGVLLGFSLLSGEFKHLGLRCLVTLPPLLVSVALFAYSLDYLFTEVTPSKDLMNQYEDNSSNPDTSGDDYTALTVWNW